MARANVEAAADGNRRRRRWFERYRSRPARNDVFFAAILLLPAVAILALVIFYPLVQALLLSLKDASLLNATVAPYTGLDNFKQLLGDEVFWIAVKNTVVLTTFSIAGSLALGMSLALVLNEDLPFRNLFRGVALIPWVMPGVVVAFLPSTCSTRRWVSSITCWSSWV